MTENDLDAGSYAPTFSDGLFVTRGCLSALIRRYGLRFMQRSQEVSGKCSSVPVSVCLFSLSHFMS